MAQAKDDKLCELLDIKKFDYTKYKTLKDGIESGKVRMELLAECNSDELSKLLDQHNVVDLMERKSFIVAIKSSNEWKQVQSQESNGVKQFIELMHEAKNIYKQGKLRASETNSHYHKTIEECWKFIQVRKGATLVLQKPIVRWKPFKDYKWSKKQESNPKNVEKYTKEWNTQLLMVVDSESYTLIDLNYRKKKQQQNQIQNRIDAESESDESDDNDESESENDDNDDGDEKKDYEYVYPDLRQQFELKTETVLDFLGLICEEGAVGIIDLLLFSGKSVMLKDLLCGIELKKYGYKIRHYESKFQLILLDILYSIHNNQRAPIVFQTHMVNDTNATKNNVAVANWAYYFTPNPNYNANNNNNAQPRFHLVIQRLSNEMMIAWIKYLFQQEKHNNDAELASLQQAQMIVENENENKNGNDNEKEQYISAADISFPNCVSIMRCLDRSQRVYAQAIKVYVKQLQRSKVNQNNQVSKPSLK